MNVYLACFNQDTVSRDEFVNCIDKIDEIENWMMFFDNTACLVSGVSAKKIFEIVHAKLPKAQFIISKVDKDSRAGWLRKSVWNFISKPKSVVS